MRKKIIIIALVFVSVTYLSENMVLAKRPDRINRPPNITAMEPIIKEDRILIFAPHPDDETLGTGGLIQKAVKAGADIHILYLTNGEHNEPAFIIYERRLVIKQTGFISMGELRQNEAISAMKFLGVPRENLIFLGYPDFGTLAIFLRYWGDSRPFKNMLTRISSVPYKNALTPNAPYKGEYVLSDIETVLQKYKPTKIFVLNPADTNRDHRAVYLFLQIALWELKDRIPQPDVYFYLIHCYGWPRPYGYHPELYHNIPKLFEKSAIEWKTAELSDEEIEQKEKAIRLYKSQCAESAFYLLAFARKNELFGKYPVIRLDAAPLSVEKGDFDVSTAFQDKVVIYGKTPDNLLINVFSGKRIGEVRRLYINLSGYSSRTEFPKMPKIKINVYPDKLQVLNRGKFVNSEKLEVKRKLHSITVKIPLDMLGDPEWLLSSVNTYAENYSTDLNAWRVIKIK